MLFFSGLNHPIPEKPEVALEVFNKRNILVGVLTLKVDVPKRKIFHLFAIAQELSQKLMAGGL